MRNSRSPSRTKSKTSSKFPSCPHRPPCPGCPLFELPYEEQIYKKQKQLQSLLTPFQDNLLDFVTSKNPYAYRNRAKLAVRSRYRCGLYQKRSHSLVEIPNCLIHLERLNELAQMVMKEARNRKISIYNEKNHSGVLRYLIIRQSQIGSALLLVLVTRTKLFPGGKPLARALRRKIPGLIGIIQNVNPQKGNVIEGKENILLDGKNHIQDRIGPFKIMVSGTAFLQGNHEMADKIYRSLEGKMAWNKEDQIYDLFSGSGLAGIYVAHKVKSVIGLDDNIQAIHDAKKNARVNRKTNMKFVLGDAEKSLNQIEKRFGKPTGFILNPPRSGCSSKTLSWILKSRAEKIAYISCSPKTLCRDLTLLQSEDNPHRFQVKQIQGFDMYPQTDQIECLAFLQRERPFAK